MAKSKIAGWRYYGFRLLKLLVVLLMPNLTASQLQMEQKIALSDQQGAGKQQEMNKVAQVSSRDYLNALSDSELTKICHDRGFSVTSRDGGASLQHEDFVEGAYRCLTLEDNLNKIMTENPVLAAELEAEIDRMRLEKTRLEQERDIMLAEITFLQERLNGVDGVSNESVTKTLLTNAGPHNGTLENATFAEVLGESFALLFQRVGQDVAFAKKFVTIILQSINVALDMVWRIMGPPLTAFYKAATDRLNK